MGNKNFAQLALEMHENHGGKVSIQRGYRSKRS